MIPAKDKAAVWRTYRSGQEQRMDPSPAYLRAAMEAVISVALLEGYRDDEIKTAPEVQMYWALIQSLEAS